MGSFWTDLKDIFRSLVGFAWKVVSWPFRMLYRGVRKLSERSFWASVAGIIEAGVFLLVAASIHDRPKNAIRRKIRQTCPPSSPYLMFRILRDPPGRVKTEYGDLLLVPIAVRPTMVDYVIEEHVTPINQRKPMTVDEIRRLCPGQRGVRVHYDLRFTDPETHEVHAFTLPKGLPEEGKTAMVMKVDDRHGHDLLVNQGLPAGANRVLISEGYGRGHSRVLAHGRTFIWTGAEDNLHIWIPPTVVAGKRVGGPYAIVQPEGWRNGTPRNYLMLPLKRRSHRHYDRPWKPIDISGNQARLEQYILDDRYIMEEKYDGGFYTVVVDKPKAQHDYPQVAIISRKPRTVGGIETNEGIDRSYQLLHLKFADYPPELYGKRIYVEIYSATAGDYPSAHGRAAAVLMMDPASSLAEQQKHGALKAVVTGVEGVGNYREQRKWAKLIEHEVRTVDPHTGRTRMAYERPLTAKNERAKREMYTRLHAHPEAEGVVFKSVDDGALVKYIFRGRLEDVEIVGVEMMQTAQPKYMRNGQVVAAQKFVLSDGRRIVIRDPSGKPGATDRLRLDVGQHPEKYVGRVAVVEPRQASRKTTAKMIRFHEAKGLQPDEV